MTLAVIGSGFGALQVYTTAMYLGFRPEQLGIFGENLNPVATYQQFAWNLGQTVLRSESESHFLPADWPTFAQLDAYARRRPAPLFRSAGRKFNPGVPEILAQAKTVTDDLGYANRVVGGTKVGWIVREPGPPVHFSLYDEDASLLGRAKHVMIAIGHGPLGLSGDLRAGPRGSPAARAHRPGLRAQALPRGRPLRGGRVGHRLRQRVGQRARRGRSVHRAAAQPPAGPAGPQRAPLPVRRQRHRRVPGPVLRPAGGLPGRRAAWHLAHPAGLGGQDQGGARERHASRR